MLFSVLIPAYNEQETIVQTIASLRETMEACRKEILVIDDGSSDDTAEKAHRAGAQVLKMAKNRGKGAALNCGAAHVRGEVILLVDADTGETAGEVRKLLAPLIREEADMSVGVFPRCRYKSGWGLVKKLAAIGLSRWTGQEFVEPLSGQRAIRRELWQQLTPLAGGYGVEVGMTLRAAGLGYRIVEVPVEMKHRRTGRDLSGIYHRGRQFWDVSLVLMRQGIKN